MSRDRFEAPPLGASQFYILLVLAQGERHGLAISKEVETLTGGAVRLIPGVLYRHLRQMEADGWIVEIDPPDPAAGVRRFYRLTARGRQVAAVEASRWDEAVRLARRCRLIPAT